MFLYKLVFYLVVLNLKTNQHSNSRNKTKVCCVIAVNSTKHAYNSDIDWLKGKGGFNSLAAIHV